MRTPIHVFYFKNDQNRCEINNLKYALYLQKKTKHVLASVGVQSCEQYGQKFLGLLLASCVETVHVKNTTVFTSSSNDLTSSPLDCFKCIRHSSLTMHIP